MPPLHPVHPTMSSPRFPAMRDQLVDIHLCPSCFAELTDVERCTRCGYPIGEPENRLVQEASVRAAELLDEREALLLRIRAGAEARAAEEARRHAAARAAARAAADERARHEESRRRAESDAARAAASAGAPPRLAPSAGIAPVPSAPASAPAPAPPQATPAQPGPVPWGAPAGQVPPAGQAPPAGAPPVGHDRPDAPRPAEPEGSSVPVVLLITGMSLVGVASIVFLTVAWQSFGLTARALTTAGITLLVIAVASWLNRLRLRATAEAVASLGALLILLDAWAVRALDLFGLLSSDPTTYWGVTLLVLTGVFEAWNRLSALRTPGIVASLTILPGIGLLAAAAAGGMTTTDRVLIGLAGAAAGALLQIVLRTDPTVRPPRPATTPRGRLRSWGAVLAAAANARRPFEFHAVTAIGAAAAGGAVFIAVSGVLADAIGATDGTPFGPGAAIAVWTAALAASAQAVLLLRRDTPASVPAFAAVCAVIAAVGFPVGGLATTGLGPSRTVSLAIASGLAIVAPALVQLLLRRLPERLHGAATAATGAGLVMAALAVLGVVGSTASAVAYFDPAGSTLTAAFVQRRAAFDAPVTDAAAPWLGTAIGLVVAVVLLVLARRLVLPGVATAVAAVTAVLVVLAPFRTGDWLLATVALALAVALHAAFLVAARFAGLATRPWAPGVAIVTWIGLALSALSAMVWSHATPLGGALVSLVVVVSLLAARLAVPRTTGDPAEDGSAGEFLRGALLSAAVLSLWAGALVFAIEGRDPTGPLLDADVWLIALATGVLLAAVACLLPGRWLSAVERPIVLLSGAPAAVLAGVVVLGVAAPSWRWPVGAGDPTVLRTIAVIALLAVLTAAATAVAVRRRSSATPPADRLAAELADATAAAGLWLLVTTLLRFGSTESDWSSSLLVGSSLAAVAIAAGSLVARIREGAGALRVALDCAMGVVLVLALATALIADEPDRALALGCAGLAALLVATGRDGLAESGGLRRHLAWLALPAWAAAWSWVVAWRWPDASGELYGLPVLGLALAAALYLALRARARRPGGLLAVIAVVAGLGVLSAWANVAEYLLRVGSPVRPAVWAVALAVVVLVAGAAAVPPAAPFVRAAGRLASGAPLHRPLRASGDVPRVPPLPWTRVRAVLTGAGAGAAAALVLTGLVRAVVDADTTPSVELAAWLAGPLAVIGFAGALATTAGPTRSNRVVTGVVAAVAASVSLAVLPLLAVGASPAGTASAALVGAAAAALWPRRRGTSAIGLVLVPLAAATAIAVTLWIRIADTTGPDDTLLAWSAPLVVALAAVVVAIRPLGRVSPAVRRTALAVVPPTAAASTALIEHEGVARWLLAAAPVAVALAVATAVLLLTRLGRVADPLDRRALDVSAGVTAVLATLLRFDEPVAWLLLGLTAVALSIAPGVGDPTRSPRSPLRWVAVPVLAGSVAAVVADVWPEAPTELYLIAAAVPVLAIGLWIAVARTRAGGPWSPEGFTLLAGAGALALVGPVLTAGRDDLGWTLGCGVAAAVVLSAAAWGALPMALRPYGDAAGGAAAAALALVPIVRLVRVGDETVQAGLGGLAGLAWGLPVVAVLLAAAVGFERRGGRVEARIGRVAVGAAALVVLVSGTLTVGRVDLDGSRVPGDTVAVATWMWVAVALPTLAYFRRRPPFDGPVLVATAVGAAALALVASMARAADPIELVSVPVGAAVAAITVTMLVRDPRRDSWPVAAPAIVLLIVPSFVAEFWEAPIWRLVGLGLVSVATLLWGVLARLRAPFVLGVGFSLAQALMAFWPRDASGLGSVPWWAWLATAGVTLVLLATTYEIRSRDERDSVSAFKRFR